MKRPRLVVLISGTGSNLQAIIDAIEAEALPMDLVGVISSNPEALGLDRARQHGVPSECVDHKRFTARAEFDQTLGARIDPLAPDWIALAGFMRILTPEFVKRYAGRLLNIHPSLLPAYPGLNTHERVLAAGETQHGATVHLVTPELDAGPTLLQEAVDIEPTDTPETLRDKVQRVEHRLYPKALAMLARGGLEPAASEANLRSRSHWARSSGPR